MHPFTLPLAQFDFINNEAMAGFAKLDTIQALQLMMTLLIGGLMVNMLFQQRNNKSAADGFNRMITQLLSTMTDQSTKANDREMKLADVNQLQAQATEKVAKALLIINREQQRQGKRQDELFEVMSNLTGAINTLVESVNRLPGKHDEMLSQMKIILGYVEGIRLKLQTREAQKMGTNEMPAVQPVIVSPTDVRTESSGGFKLESTEVKKVEEK